MKKRWMPFILACVAAAFVAGTLVGTGREAAAWRDMSAAWGRVAPTIAVVNADAGVSVDGVWANYSAAIIDTLGPGFSLVSPAMAQTGLESGMFSAAVTFPSDVSAKILAFNAYRPERVRLGFQMSPHLGPHQFMETHIAITELQLAINTTLAGTYVSSVLRQFHEAQDQVRGVFRNSSANLAALELFTLRGFAHDLELDGVPEIPLYPRGLDTGFYMGQVASFARDVAGWYLGSYRMASDAFARMREGLFALTEGFPGQEDDWVRMLGDWSMEFAMYGGLLEAYSAYVRLHDESLHEWFRENEEWGGALSDLQHMLEDWHAESVHWFGSGESWHGEYMGFLSAIVEFEGGLVAFRDGLEARHGELEADAAAVMDGLAVWLDALTYYEQGLNTLYGSLYEMIAYHNERAGEANAFIPRLLGWHGSLYGHYLEMAGWARYVNDTHADMVGWLVALDENQTTLDTLVAAIRAGLSGVPPLPDGVCHMDLDELWHGIYVPVLPLFPDIYRPSLGAVYIPAPALPAMPAPVPPMMFPARFALPAHPAWQAAPPPVGVPPAFQGGAVVTSLFPAVPGPEGAHAWTHGDVDPDAGRDDGGGPPHGADGCPPECRDDGGGPADGGGEAGDACEKEPGAKPETEPETGTGPEDGPDGGGCGGPEDGCETPPPDGYGECPDGYGECPDENGECPDENGDGGSPVPPPAAPPPPPPPAGGAGAPPGLPACFTPRDTAHYFAGDLNEFALSLQEWHTQLQGVADELLRTRDGLARAAEGVAYRHAALELFYGELRDVHDPWKAAHSYMTAWHEGHYIISGELFGWDIRLREHLALLSAFHEGFGGLIYDAGNREWPDLADDVAWGNVLPPEGVAVGLPDAPEPLDMARLPQWGGALSPPDAHGGEGMGAFEAVPLVSHVFAPAPPELEAPPGFYGEGFPEQAEWRPMLTAMRPLSPLVGPPPRPDGFWRSLGDMHAQLSGFDMDGFLSDDVHARVELSLREYEVFLETVRGDIAYLFEDNIWMMRDVHAQYGLFVEGLRRDVFAAQAAGYEYFRAAVGEFASAQEENIGDTNDRLSSFASMLPHSRLPAGVNRQLVDFTVAPFGFTAFGLPDGHAPAPADVPPGTAAARRNQRVAAAAVGGAFLVTAAGGFISSLLGKKRAGRGQMGP